jgi:hypothetical protein
MVQFAYLPICEALQGHRHLEQGVHGAGPLRLGRRLLLEPVPLLDGGEALAVREVEGLQGRGGARHGGGNLEITWDLPNARFGTGPEPLKVSTSLLFMILKLSLCLATYITRRRMARLHLMLYIQMQS